MSAYESVKGAFTERSDFEKKVTSGDTNGLIADGVTAGAVAATTKSLLPKTAPLHGAANKAPACNSFVPGTLVLLANGDSKPIEDVEIGGKVLAADEETGELTEGRAVTALIRGEGDKTLVTLTVTDADGDTQQIVATDAHPFWAPELGEWVDAIDLTAGDWLQTSAGTWVQVTAIDVHQRQAVVHNLTVAVDHTYYVLAGQTPVLVHNSNCPKGKLSDPLPRGMNNKIALAYDDVKAGRIPSHDTYGGREHPWWAGAKEFRVPGRPETDRILEKELPNGVKVYGWTSTHYTKIQRFSAPHFPDSGWN